MLYACRPGVCVGQVIALIDDAKQAKSLGKSGPVEMALRSDIILTNFHIWAASHM